MSKALTKASARMVGDVMVRPRRLTFSPRSRESMGQWMFAEGLQEMRRDMGSRATAFATWSADPKDVRILSVGNKRESSQQEVNDSRGHGHAKNERLRGVEVSDA